MPIYEYACEACSDEVEMLQPINAPPPNCCARCGGKMERKFSRANSNLNKFTGRSSERYAKHTVERQAQIESDRLTEHSKKTGIAFNDLFEVHD